MKKRLTTISNILFVIAAVLALVVGTSLGSVLDFSREFIGEAFPVSYDVQLLNGSRAVISDAEVFFNDGRAFISSDSYNGIVSMDEAIFTCTAEELLAKNVVRSGLLFALLSVINVVVVCVPACAAMNFRTRAARLRRRKVVRLAASGQEFGQQASAAAAA